MKLGIVLKKPTLKLRRKKDNFIQIAEKLLRFPDVPIACMCGIFPYNLLSCILKINHSCIGKYTSPLDGMSYITTSNLTQITKSRFQIRVIYPIKVNHFPDPMGWCKNRYSSLVIGAVISLVSRWPREFLGGFASP